ncbi:hypothetical protein HZH68_007209 [Vespula germanica]|uniref:Uncharacterized protein n=1 Tax=Vespula germanica TaxID=30212 RepID=A0A834NAV9_VESGE|nr:hypothetical protein HZH68_007209 [Vespula germanica]
MRSELGEENGSGSGDVGWMGRMRSGRGGVCLSATVISNRKGKSKKVSAREVEVTETKKKKKRKRKKKDDREERLKSRMVLGKDMRTFNGGVKSSKEKDEHFSLLSTILCGNDGSFVF